jgi:hypothetical protein
MSFWLLKHPYFGVLKPRSIEKTELMGEEINGYGKSVNPQSQKTG